MIRCEAKKHVRAGLQVYTRYTGAVQVSTCCGVLMYVVTGTMRWHTTPKKLERGGRKGGEL